METPSTGSPLTSREREVANLIGLGLTNRQIGQKLSISQRTAGAHVQNILNKLGANNRAQIASWSARAAPASVHVSDLPVPPNAAAGAAADVPAHLPPATRVVTPHRRRRPVFFLLAVGGVAVIIAATYYGASRSPATVTSPVQVGAVVYEAKLAGDGDGFSARYILGDPNASAIRFVQGEVDYTVVAPGGNTGNSVAMPLLSRYYAEVKMAVVPGSNVEFWFNLATPNAHPGDHLLISLSTGAEELQLVNFAGQDMEFLGPLVPIPGLQSGRGFTVSARVDPPNYEVYLDGRSVIKIQRTRSLSRQAPGFAIFGNASGTVRLTSIKVWELT